MKKKNVILLLLISIIVLGAFFSLIYSCILFVNDPNSQTRAIYEEEFITYMKQKNCPLINVLEKETQEGIEAYYVTDDSLCPYQISFTKFNINQTKNSFFHSLADDVLNNNGSHIWKNSIQNNFNDYYEYSTIGKNYKVVVRKQDTIMYASGSRNNKNDINQIFKDLGYHYGTNPDAIKLMNLSLGLLGILIFVSWWKLNIKMGRKGYICLIPFYNIFCFTKDVLGSWKYLFLLLIPTVYMILLLYNLGKVFGKKDGFCVGLILLSVIFLPLLAFDDSIYCAKN